ncbi:DUF4358 domain-containing protein [Clostridiaceae bacterium NSJ-31]|uniref:DUF4358 domain-containing protein n=1 Tax=Ligaoa zhengdingensis TaxID=2763658 RepID=A0A926I2L0_9FIRM|nr:DUF4358 domain-containing protein [Ligaoa zhengdingensis]MBC8545389.1 DUF4358 domain-containing protein [Ligaoa zhengdingensis]
MKRPLAMFLAMTALLGIAAGCTEKKTGLKDNDTTLQQIVDAVAEEMGDFYVQMPSKLDDETLENLYSIEPDSVEEYAGDFAVTMTSADNFVAVKAKEGKAESVRQALENRRAQLQQTFEQYLPGPLEIAKAGKVLVKGDYVFLIMLGDPEKGASNEIARAEAVVNRYFNE